MSGVSFEAAYEDDTITLVRPEALREQPAQYTKEYEELEKAYLEKKLHAADLKSGVAEAMDRAVEPVRSHFEKRKELLEVFGEAEITR